MDTTGIRGAGPAWRRLDRRCARWACRRGRLAIVGYAFVCFGLKQASARLFGGAMVALLLITGRWYPPGLALARYDVLTLSAVAIQLVLLASGLESLREARVIVLFHLTGTTMEVFKTAMGSWSYPEPSLLHVAGVPLFSGFMYAFRVPLQPASTLHADGAAGSGDLPQLLHPSRVARCAAGPVRCAGLAARADLGVLPRPPALRRMPLMLGLVLVALFIWLAENVGTFSRAWLYPAQRHGWSMVSPNKLGAWLLLVVIGYVMVWALHRRGADGGRKPATGLNFPATAHFLRRGDACFPRTARLKVSIPNWPVPSPTKPAARKTTSS